MSEPQPLLQTPPVKPFYRMTPREIAWEFYSGIAPFAGFAGQPFYLRFWPFFLAQTFVSPLPFLLFAVFGPSHVQGVLLLLVLLKVGGGGLITSILVARYFPVLVNERGLRARNPLGVAVPLLWGDILGVRPLRWMFFTPFLVLKTTRGPIWLPRFLHGQAQLETLILQYAPPENPLARFLRANSLSHPL